MPQPKVIHKVIILGALENKKLKKQAEIFTIELNTILKVTVENETI